MSGSRHFVVFVLNEQRYALPLSSIERIVRALEITPLPKAPEIVLGIINFQGQIIPVVSIRKRFCLPERIIDLMDQFIIANTSRRTLAIVADEVEGVIESSDGESIVAAEIAPGLNYIEGAVKTVNGLILIQDLDKFLSIDEERMLDGAMITS